MECIELEFRLTCQVVKNVNTLKYIQYGRSYSISEQKYIVSCEMSCIVCILSKVSTAVNNYHHTHTHSSTQQLSRSLTSHAARNITQQNMF